MRKACFFALKQWKMAVKSLDFWGVVFVLALFFSLFFQKAGQAVRAAGEDISIFAMLPISVMQRDFIMLLLGGLLFVVSDAPAVFDGAAFYLLRADRAAWYLGQLFYMALMTVTYFSAVVFLQTAFYFPNVRVTGGWGSAVYSGTAFSSEYDMLFPKKLLEQNPAGAWLKCFGFFLLLGLLFALICCVANMLLENDKIGVLICVLLTMEQMNIMDLDLHAGLLSPAGIALEGIFAQGFGILATACYFVFLIMLLAGVGMRACQRLDILKGRRE